MRHSDACHVLGIDLSSKFLDLVLLAESGNRASWTRLTLEGPNAFERARDVAEKMPQPGWYEAHGVYLCAIEKPFFLNGQDMIRLVQGTVLAEIPRSLHVWEVTPKQWKTALGLKQSAKPVMDAFPVGMTLDVATPEQLERDGSLPQDAFDALGVALYARDLNAKAISDALSAA